MFSRPTITSWGGMKGKINSLTQPWFSSDMPDMLALSPKPSLVIGNLRSYGDQCLNPQGNYVQTTRCDRVIALDKVQHRVICESGMKLQRLQQLLSLHGYMLPVTPGTAHVTVGGAIANDVHGKNHHSAGTFGCHVVRFALARTTGETHLCSAEENSELFHATIGGMGMTGAIIWAELALRSITTPFLDIEHERFNNLAEFFTLEATYQQTHSYSVAWIDCLATGKSLGRGIYSRANPATIPSEEAMRTAPLFSIPFTPPISPLFPALVKRFNDYYFHRTWPKTEQLHYAKWLYPLDRVGQWNRLYGTKGLVQFQCVIPTAEAEAAIKDMLQEVANAKEGSFLAVLKNFGDKKSPGLMSFPLHGTTLALDFPYRGKATEALLQRLYHMTQLAKGRIYFAKDRFAPKGSMEQGYSEVQSWLALRDPGMTSQLVERLLT